jgi:hypothetical protein
VDQKVLLLFTMKKYELLAIKELKMPILASYKGYQVLQKDNNQRLVLESTSIKLRKALWVLMLISFNFNIKMKEIPPSSS